MKFFTALVVLVSLITPVLAEDNIVIVFDNSGSMGEYMRTAKATRMKVAQDAMISVLAQVPDSTKVGILTFNGWIYDLQKVDRAAMDKAIRGVRPGGGTPLYEFIKQGGDRLLKERAKQNNVGYYKLLVVTDGEADNNRLNNDDKFKDGSFKPGVLKDIIGRGVIVDAIGLEMRKDHPLKTQINGRYMRGDDPESIQESIKTAVAEVGFNGKDDLSEEAFKEISELPDSFVRASLQGLTQFRNYPLGEKAPVYMVKNGVVMEVPNPEEEKSGSILGAALVACGWIMLIVGMILLAMVYFFKCRGR